MKKMENLKARLGANACLTADQAYRVKGGDGGTTTTTVAVTTVTSTVSSPSATEDDKRRERPGGLTSQ